MTFLSYDQKEIKDKSDELKKRVESIKDCDIEEEIKKGNLISSEDFLKKLKERLKKKGHQDIIDDIINDTDDESDD